MGLDMYLKGRRYLFREKRVEGGHPVSEVIFELGYWRKHPDLHGYIVDTFADGVDECQKITLTAEDLEKIIEAVKNDKLVHTEGFFFGRSYKPGEKDEFSSYEDQKKEDIGLLRDALCWLKEKDDGAHKTVFYRASW